MKRIAITVLTAALLLVNFLSVPETAYAARPAVKPAQSADELLRMMPDANAVVIINVAQLSVQMQALLSANAELASKFQSALNRITSETGVNLQAIEQVAVGLSLSDTAQPTPVILVTGAFDQEQILARLAAGSGGKWKSKRYKGQRIYLQPPSQSGTAGKLGSRATISFFDDQSKIAFGSTADVKRVIKARAGNQPSVVANTALMSALHETSANASIRFAFIVPEEIREYLGRLPGAPGLLRPLGSINQVVGTVDIGNGLQANVSLITPSATEAADLVALINQGLALAKIAGGNFPGGQLIISILNGVSVAQAGNAANVSVTVPADLIQKLIDEFKSRNP
jgi:hypothetical protein